MRNEMETYGMWRSSYLLEYDRRQIQSCADTLDSLASVFSEMNRESEEREADAHRTEPADRETLWRARRARESRNGYAFYMRQMSGMMQAVAGCDAQIIRLGGRQEKQILRALAGEGIRARDVRLVRGPAGRLEISILACAGKDGSVTVAEIAGYLSVLMDIRLVPERRNPYFIGADMVTLYFAEEPVFCYLSASATAIRENEAVSGDSFSFFEADGTVTAILSDGVGSGDRAAKDSGRIVDLTEQILDAGLGCRMAAGMLGNLLGMEEEENRMSTLDLCRIDLHTGECVIAKAGAVSTFIKRGAVVERVGDPALPLGMLAGELPEESVRQLEDGDMVILVSDGVLQDWACEDSEFVLARQIERMIFHSPVDVANALLRFAIGQSQGRIRDDMTVLVAGIWKNEGNVFE